MELDAFLSAELTGFALVFARLGSVSLFVPGFGDSNIPNRHKLSLALAMTLALFPASGVGPVSVDSPVLLAPLFAIEITVGVWIGMTARILFSALQFAGYQAALVSGLANALAPQTGQFQGATVMAGALMMAGTALIFATDLHHLIIRGILLSYDVFPVGDIMPGDLAQQIIRAVGASFYIGLSIAAPFLVMGLLLNAGLGLANRMMPTLPVFFVAAPVLIAAALIVLIFAAPSMLRTVLSEMADWLGTLRF